MNYKFKHAIYIGRFQPAHAAHLKSIGIALEKAQTLIIFIGSAKRPSDLRNPWSYESRIDILKDAIQEYYNEDLHPGWTDFPPNSILKRIIFAPLRDYHYNNGKWASEVVATANRLGAEASPRSTVLVGAKKDNTSFYLDMFQSWTLEEHPIAYNGLSAVSIRYELFENGNIDSVDHIMDVTKQWASSWMHDADGRADFIKGEWAFHKAEWKKYEKLEHGYTAITGDAVIHKSGCILLIKRGSHPGKGLWALPGGYINTSEWVTDGLLREVKEETKISVPKTGPGSLKDHIKTIEYFDNPNRSLRGRLLTFAHVIDLGYGPLPSVKGGDDAAGAFWIPLQDIYRMEDELFEDHFDILIKTTGIF